MSKSEDLDIATCQNYRNQVEAGLNILHGGLKGELSREVETTDRSIAEHSKELTQYGEFHSQCRRLK